MSKASTCRSPCTFSVYGEWTKKGGIGVDRTRQAGRPHAALGRRGLRQLIKAKNADVYLYTRETTQEYPELLRDRRDR